MNKRQNSRVPLGILVACFVLLALSRTIQAADAPFVAAFDRFARHGEIAERAAGRLLLAELSCTACHASEDSQLAPKGGPLLDGVGNRLHPQWLKRFLLHPTATKPGTTMPDILAGVPNETKPAVVDALAAFLSSQPASYPEIRATGANPVLFEFWKQGDAEQGKQLYHQIGCVACHAADGDYEVVEVKPSPIDQLLAQLDPEEIAELGLASAARRVESVPHGNLAAKYTYESLTHFLLKPEATRPAGRMPNFSLTAMDAAHIAAYLLDRNETEAQGSDATAPSERPPQTGASSSANEQLIAEGRRLFVELRCANCHAIEGAKEKLLAAPLAKLGAVDAASCFVGRETKRGQPDFPLDDAQKMAMEAAMSHLESKKPLAADELLEGQLLQLNCYACHEREKRGGVGRFRKPYFETVGNVDIGDEGRLPPQLTNVGLKLQQTWLKNVLAGKVRVRPHMHIRMPQFAADKVKPLPALLVKADDGQRQPTDQQVFGQANLAEFADAGRALMDAGCVQCHAYKGESLPGTVGVDLQSIALRVQPQWFHDFLLDPASLKERTRMPTFFPGGVSQNKAILAGNTEQQIAAMWAYLRDLDRQPLPQKIVDARAQDYELTPTDRPIVMRTFMQEAGTHAIAVGFPQKIHYAFDAESISLALAWRGRFVDAEGTWFVRFAPPADPLGDERMRFPAGVALAALDNPKAEWPADAEAADYRFSGYRLDKSGVPTFLYKIGGLEVEDRIAPAAAQTLKRRLVIRSGQPGKNARSLWLRAHVGKSLSSSGATAVASESGLQVIVGDDLARGAQLRSVNGGQQWIMRVDIDAEKVIELEYKW